jgi:hypothetical protein
MSHFKDLQHKHPCKSDEDEFQDSEEHYEEHF